MTEYIVCPLCAEIIHRHYRDRVSTRIRIPSRSRYVIHGAAALAELASRALEEQRQEQQSAEDACVSHYEEHHALRYALWRRFKWTWLMNWPHKKPPVTHIGQMFELTFPK